MKKIKAVINIIKLLKIGLNEQDIFKIEKELKDFYTHCGVLGDE